MLLVIDAGVPSGSVTSSFCVMVEVGDATALGGYNFDRADGAIHARREVQIPERVRRGKTTANAG